MDVKSAKESQDLHFHLTPHPKKVHLVSCHPDFYFTKRFVDQNVYLTACQSALFHVAKSVVLQTSYKGALNVAREPGYCLHKPTGQAYVRLGGKVIYLGA